MVKLLAGTMALVFATGCLLYLVPEQRQLSEDVPAGEAVCETRCSAWGVRERNTMCTLFGRSIVWSKITTALADQRVSGQCKLCNS